MIRSVIQAPVLLTCTLFLSWTISGASEPAAFLAEVPQKSLVLARVDRLDALDASLRPLADTFGIPYPSLVKVLDGIDGLDTKGDAISGLAQHKDELIPFVLLPVTDYKTFVRGVDGDPEIEVTPIALGGEELFASKRGRWALLTNQTEGTVDWGRMDRNTQDAFAPLVKEEAVTIALTPAGLNYLDKLAKSPPRSRAELVRLRRLHRAAKPSWSSLDYWQDMLAVYQPVVSRLRKGTGGALFALETHADQGLTIRCAFLLSDTSPTAPELQQLPGLALPRERQIVAGIGPWGLPWTDLLTQIYIDSYTARGDSLGIQQFAEEEFGQFRQSARSASEKVQSAAALLIAPQNDKPTMSNMAVLVTTGDTDKLTESVDQVMQDWNRLVENSPRSVDFVYDSEPIQCQGFGGTRYSVDLPTAFRGMGIPEVRQVLDKMYGREGVMVMDVVTLDNQRILLSDLPDKLRDELIDSVIAEPETNEAAASGTDGGWKIDLDPAALQDWLNDCKRISFGERIIGWKPKKLDSTSKISIHVKTDTEAAIVTIEIPRDVVEAVGKIVNSN